MRGYSELGSVCVSVCFVCAARVTKTNNNNNNAFIALTDFFTHTGVYPWLGPTLYDDPDLNSII